MSEPRRCPKCGAELATTAMEGLCPNCVARVVFGAGQPKAGAASPQNVTIQLTPEDTGFEGPGTRIGRYKLLEKIGEGGFGAVYMAEQLEPVQRRVALKLIKAGMDSREVIARFEAERQALALMDHPNIARVLDAGATEAGRPYFVMELVRGVRITDHCDQNKLSAAERLALFMKVCHAIQHAHQKGIIHRDIKPSNVLVTLHDGESVPKVIDFGIAKALGQKLTEKTLFTGFAQMIGTPAYMSPEQAELSGLDIDTRSDIYSLGVLLYELLTGTTPFDKETLAKAAVDEIRRLIREADPPKPSTRLHTMGAKVTDVAKHRHTEPAALSRMVRGDLDWIVMKCLEKDRTRRYETADNLALDLTNFLKHRPVTAAAPGKVYLARKFVRRHQAELAVAAALATLLAAGAVVSTWQAIRATRAEKKSEKEASKSKQVASFLRDMLEGVGPSVALGRDTTLMKEILDKTAARVGRDLTNQPEVEAELRATLGNVYSALSEFTNSHSMRQKVLELRKDLQGSRSPEVGKAMNYLAMSLRDEGRLKESESMQREALAMQREFLGDQDVDVATSMGDLSNVLADQGKGMSEAVKLQEGCLKILRQKLGDGHLDTAMAVNNLAAMYYRAGQVDKAVQHQKEAMGMQEKNQGRNSPDFAQSLNNLSIFLSTQGDLAGAEVAARQAIEIRTLVLGSNHAYVATSLNNLASLLWRQMRLGEAERFQLQALAIHTNRLGLSHPEVATCMNNLGTIFHEQGKFAEAEAIYYQILGIWTNLSGAECRDMTYPLHNLGRVLCDSGRLADSEARHRDSLVLQRKFMGEEHPHVAAGYFNLGTVLWNAGKLFEAETNHWVSLSLRRKLFGNEHPDVMVSLNGIALVYRDERRLSEAETCFTNALAGRRKLLGNQHPLVAVSLENLGVLLMDQDRFAEAEPLARECLAIRQEKLPGTWRVASARLLLGCALLGKGNFAEAEPLLAEGYEQMQKDSARVTTEGIRRQKDILRCVARLYKTGGKEGPGADWQHRLSELDKPTG